MNSVLSLEQAVETAAAEVARQWPDVIDAEDAAQEIWVRILESPQTVERLQGMDGTRQVRALIAIGSQIASEYRSSYELFSGQVVYSLADVEVTLLRGVLAGSQTTTQTERLDLDEALAMLKERSPHLHRALVDEYVLGIYDKSSGSARKTLSRARVELTKLMNRVHASRRYSDGPGSRKAISNSQAAFVTKSMDDRRTRHDRPNLK